MRISYQQRNDSHFLRESQAILSNLQLTYFKSKTYIGNDKNFITLLDHRWILQKQIFRLQIISSVKRSLLYEIQT